MKRAPAILPVALALVLVGSCEFAQKHPAVTVGITAGSIGFLMCEINVEKPGTCGIVGAGIGVVLGGITGLVTLFADTNQQEAPPDEQNTLDPVNDEPPGLPPGMTPLTIDGGVPTASPDAGLAVPAAPADAR